MSNLLGWVGWLSQGVFRFRWFFLGGRAFSLACVGGVGGFSTSLVACVPSLVCVFLGGGCAFSLKGERRLEAGEVVVGEDIQVEFINEIVVGLGYIAGRVPV